MAFAILLIMTLIFSSVIVFSPTVASDEKWDWVKEQDLLAENVELKKWIKDMANRREYKDRIVQPPPFSMEASGLVDLKQLAGGEERNKGEKFDGKIPESCFYTEYSESDLVKIMTEQMTLIKLLKKHNKTKHLANRILFVFDDLVGSNLFSFARDNPFKRLNTNHRHHSASILMVTQAYKEVRAPVIP